jgi:hypothetical protein
MKINLMNNLNKRALTKHKSSYFLNSMNKSSNSIMAKRGDMKQG